MTTSWMNPWQLKMYFESNCNQILSFHEAKATHVSDTFRDISTTALQKAVDGIVAILHPDNAAKLAVNHDFFVANLDTVKRLVRDTRQQEALEAAGQVLQP